MTFDQKSDCYVLKLDGQVSVLEQFTTLLDELKAKFEVAEVTWLRLYHLPEGTPFEVKASLSLDCMGRRWGVENCPPLTLVERTVYMEYLFASDYYFKVKGEFDKAFPSEPLADCGDVTPIKKRRIEETFFSSTGGPNWECL